MTPGEAGRPGSSVSEIDMEVMKMTRFRKILLLAGLSAYLLAPGACTITGDGISILPSVQSMIQPYINMLTGIVT